MLAGAEARESDGRDEWTTPVAMRREVSVLGTE
jgi:hypothetical protein